MQYGADPSIKNKDGQTPLDICFNEKIKKLLKSPPTIISKPIVSAIDLSSKKFSADSLATALTLLKAKLLSLSKNLKK